MYPYAGTDSTTTAYICIVQLATRSTYLCFGHATRIVDPVCLTCSSRYHFRTRCKILAEGREIGFEKIAE